MTPLAQGAALLGSGRFHEALAAFGQALAQDPVSLEARLGLARASAGTGDVWAAVAWLNDACRVAPEAPAPAHDLANLLLAQRQYAQALPVYQRLYGDLQARDRATLLHHGFCLEQAGRLDEAATQYREALAREPGFMEAHVNLAGVLWRLEDHEGTLTHARQAVALAPDHPYAVRILGTALLHLNRLDEAEAALRRALQLQPGFALAQVDLALALLLAGRLEEGWALYQSRWNDTDRMVRPRFFQPALEWQGPARQPLRGKRLLVYAEQGLGDVIQFIRYAAQLQADGATVQAVVQPELIALVEGMPGVVCFKPGTDLVADGHVALLDLPLHYGTTLATVPATVPYLRAPDARRAQWRERLRPWAGQFKVGLAWAGAPVQVNNRNRSMPLSDLLALTGLDGVQCFSLQKSDGGGFTDVAPDDPRLAGGRLVDLTADWHDFADSAAMIEGLDLVITIDSAVAHLAGALARPVWVMLPPNPDWRWLLERDDSPWYPSMRLFRRGFGEARAAQVARVDSALRHWLLHMEDAVPGATA
ncbi:MAG: tetratricopeptide repeat protein [Ramlibacter sp.]|nr:tetratricopeptide repeat protein [Ramlibacter sp.]